MAARKERQKATPKGYRRIEAIRRPFWVPQTRDRYPENAITEQTVGGVVAGIREVESRTFHNKQIWLDLDNEDGGATIVCNGNLPRLLKDGAIGEGMTVRIDYDGFLEPDKSKGLPQGLHLYSLFVAD